jgi:hypothetical protein
MQATRAIAENEKPEDIKEIICWNCNAKIIKTPEGTWEREVSQ